MAIRRSHFKDAILVAKNFSGIYNFYGAVDGLDHGAPNSRDSKVGKPINRECRRHYNTELYVFLGIETKGVMRQRPEKLVAGSLGLRERSLLLADSFTGAAKTAFTGNPVSNLRAATYGQSYTENDIFH